MIKIRSISSGAEFVLFEGVRTYAANQWITFNEVKSSGQLEVIDTIGNSALGFMLPYKSPYLRPEFGISDAEVDSYYKTVTRPDTGRVQRSVFHAKFGGYLDFAAPDIDTFDQYWNGKRYTLHRIGGSVYTDDIKTFAAFLENADIEKCEIHTHYEGGGVAAIIAVCARRTNWRGGSINTWVMGTYTTSESQTATFSKMQYMGGWEWNPPSTLPPPDEGWAWDKIHSYSGVAPLPVRARGSAVTLPYDESIKTQIINKLSQLEGQLMSKWSDNVRPLLNENWGPMCVSALENTRFIPVNQLEFWKDVGMTFSEVGAFTHAAETIVAAGLKSDLMKGEAYHQLRTWGKKLRSGTSTKVDTLAMNYAEKTLARDIDKQVAKEVAKATSDAYLSYYYGTRLAMSDIELMSLGISKFIWTYYSEFRRQVRFAHENRQMTHTLHYANKEFVCNTDMNYTLCYNPYTGISEIEAIMHETGWGINTHQIWECIPFSFVVDWGVNITEILKAFDYDAYLHKLSINYEQLGYKTRVDVSSFVQGLFGIPCSLEFSIYSRRYSTTPTVTPAALDIWGRPQTHFIQGAALLLSNG